MTAFGVQRRKACKTRMVFVLHEQKSTCGLLRHSYSYVYIQRDRYVESHGHYRHVFHDWSSHFVNQRSTHFTLQQLTGTSGLHKKYISE